MSALRIRALPVRQHGKTMYVVSIPLSDLVLLKRKVEPYDSAIVDQYARREISETEFRLRFGYQRYRDQNRVNKFVRYITSPTSICPTAILLNDRDGKCRFDPASGQITIPVDLFLFIVDGQHRDAGFEAALAADPTMKSFEVILVITMGIAKYDEMQNFQTINKEAKGIATELVTSITAILDPKAQSESLTTSQVAKVSCAHAMNRLASDPDSPWCGLIARSDERAKKKLEKGKSSARKAAVGGSTFTDSLRPIYDYFNSNGWFKYDASDAEAKGKVIGDVSIAFFNAVKSLLPKTFEEPNDYMVSSTAGVSGLILFLQRRLGDLYSARRPWTEDEFKKLISTCPWFTDEAMWRKEYNNGNTIEREGGRAAEIAQGGGKSSGPKLYREIEKDYTESLSG